jgi:hypothetical protein
MGREWVGNAVTLPVDLQAVIDEMDVLSDELTAYINRKTGELFTVTEEDVLSLEAKGNGLDVPEWQAEILPKIKEVLESEDFFELPDKFEIHEYSIMEQFCLGVANARLRDALSDAIRGRGAFRRFKDLMHRHGFADDWYAYRNAAFGKIAAEFLRAEGIAYRALEPPG